MISDVSVDESSCHVPVYLFVEIPHGVPCCKQLMAPLCMKLLTTESLILSPSMDSTYPTFIQAFLLFWRHLERSRALRGSWYLVVTIAFVLWIQSLG